MTDNGRATLIDRPSWEIDINPNWLAAAHYQKSTLADMPDLPADR
tara:strand:+ start:192 stop:326 length:135 start_codon:yes stop_codon:yes gene_type:complete